MSSIQAAVLREEFSDDPFAAGAPWRVIGDAGQFHWNPVEKNLAVTWDSSRQNTFFFLPLGAVLTSHSAFEFAVDLTLFSAGPRPGTSRTNVLQIALALVKQGQLPDGYAQRTVSGRARNMLDFSFFPLADYGPFGTSAFIAPAIFGEKYAAYSFGNPYDLADGQNHRIRCRWDPLTRRFATEITGIPGIQPTDPALPTADDFAVDALAVVLWNEGNTPGDSLMANGTLDNITVTLPDPAQYLTGPLTIETATQSVRFLSRMAYRYQLEGTGDLNSWNVVAGPLAGTGDELSLSDLRDAYFLQQFYRVRATAIR